MSKKDEPQVTMIGHLPHPLSLQRDWLRRPLPSPLAEWAVDMEGDNLALNTRLAYIRDLANFSDYLAPLNKTLETALPEDLLLFARQMTLMNLAVSTRARHITAMRTFYEWLRRVRGLSVSVAQNIRPPRRHQRLHRFWTETEVRRFRRAFTGTDETVLRDRAMMELGLMGLRVGEVTGLNLDQVSHVHDPLRARIRIVRKGPKEQILPLTQDAREALHAWLSVRPDEPTDAVFFRLPFQPGRNDRLVYASVEKIMLEYARQAGVRVPKGIAFHLLRHTAGQQMSEIGIGIEEAQAYLGHRDPKTTMVYYEVSDKRLRRISQRVNYNTESEATDDTDASD